MSHNIKIIINEQSINEILPKRQGAVINTTKYTEDPLNPTIFPSDLDKNVETLLKHHFKFTKDSALSQYRNQIADDIRKQIDSDDFSEIVARRLQRVPGFDEETIRKKAYPNKAEGESFIPQPGSDNTEYSRMFMDEVINAFAINVLETAAGKRRKNIADDDFSNWVSQTVKYGVARGLTDPKTAPNMKLQHWCDYASCAPSTPDDTEQGETEPEEEGRPEDNKEPEDDKGKKGPPPLPDEDGYIPTDPKDIVSVEDVGIPIYKFGSRDAAGPDGKRTQPLISKLMKTGLPKSVINTVVKSIVKDLKASNVPFYESKEQLTNVLKEHIKSALLGRLDEATTARSLARKAAAREETAKKVFKDLKDGESITIDQSDTEALSDLKQRFSSLASALMKNKLINGTYTKKGEDVKYAPAAANSSSGETKSSLEKKQDNQPGSQLDSPAASAGITGEDIKADPAVCSGKTSENPDDSCFFGYLQIAMIAKALATYKVAAAKMSAAEAESVLQDPIDNEEIEKRQNAEYLKFKEPPLDWFEIGNLVDSSQNWKTIWSGTKDNGFADGLSRREKISWFALSWHILFPDGKPTRISGLGRYGDEVADMVPAAAAAMVADKSSGQGNAQGDMFKGVDPNFRKDVKVLISKLKKFQKDALRRNEVLKKAAIAKAKLKSGARGGGQIQLSVLNQQLDTISGPGLEGRDSKVVGGKRTPGKPAMRRNKETGKMEPVLDKDGKPMMAGASRRQKSLALKTAQNHLKPYLKKYGLSISESQELELSKAIVEMASRFGTEDPQIFTKIIKESLLKKGLIK